MLPPSSAPGTPPPYSPAPLLLRSSSAAALAAGFGSPDGATRSGSTRPPLLGDRGGGSAGSGSSGGGGGGGGGFGDGSRYSSSQHQYGGDDQVDSWEKVLWRRQPFPDNFVPSTFCDSVHDGSEMGLVNQKLDYWTMVRHTAVLMQQISIVVMFSTAFRLALIEDAQPAPDFETPSLSLRSLLHLDATLIVLFYGLHHVLSRLLSASSRKGDDDDDDDDDDGDDDDDSGPNGVRRDARTSPVGVRPDAPTRPRTDGFDDDDDVRSTGKNTVDFTVTGFLGRPDVGRPDVGRPDVPDVPDDLHRPGEEGGLPAPAKKTAATLFAAGAGGGGGIGGAGDGVKHLLAQPQRLLLFLVILMAVSPVLHTLTQSYASDTIYLLTGLLGTVHMFSYDFTYMLTMRREFKGTISMNAALLSSVLLASRLSSNLHCFALMCLAVELFALSPIVRHMLRQYSQQAHLVLTCAMVLGVAVLLALTHRRFFGFLFLFAAVVIPFVSPLVFLRVQRFKARIAGPWDLGGSDKTSISRGKAPGQKSMKTG